MVQPLLSETLLLLASLLQLLVVFEGLTLLLDLLLLEVEFSPDAA